MPVTVAFFTHGWTCQFLYCYRKVFPNKPLLVVDNNPTSQEQALLCRWQSNESWKHYYPFVLAERDFLSSRDDIVVIPAEKDNYHRYHGTALDRACRWCLENDYTHMLNTDPDVRISGKQWFKSLCSAAREGCWMAANPPPDKCKYPNTTIRIPFIVDVKKACEYADNRGWSFKHTGRRPNFYDTGGWYFYKWKEESSDRCAFVSCRGIKHFWSGSYANFTHNERNCPLITHL